MQTDTQDSFQHDDLGDAARMARQEVDDAKARLASAADRIRTEARNAGSTLSSLVLDELDRRAGDLANQLRSLAGRMRGETSDEDAAAPAPEIVDQAAALIEDLSHRLDGQSVRQIGQQFDRFGRENPALFVMGCLLTGAIAGRIIVASPDNRSIAESARSAFAGARTGSWDSGGGRSGSGRSGSGPSGGARDRAGDDRDGNMEDAAATDGSAEDRTDTHSRAPETGTDDDLPLGRPTSDNPTDPVSEHGKNG